MAHLAEEINEQFIVDKKGNPTAVILSIDIYKKIISALEKSEVFEKNKNFDQLPEVKELINKGLEDIKSDRVTLWKDIWNEL